MPTQQRPEPHAESEKSAPPQLNAVIGKQVMQRLGQPDNLQRVQVCRLWEDHYRVNVLVGADAASVKVAHSYFLEADGDGTILTSAPKIARRY
jgi:hypothetical protein